MSVSNRLFDTNERLVIVYDGDCPVCKRYVRLIRIRKSVGVVALENAREMGPFSRLLSEHGYRLDEGMAVIYAGKIYYGHDAINIMALLSSPSGLFNRINAWIFRSSFLSRIFYPILRCCRGVLLRTLGISRLDI